MGVEKGRQESRKEGGKDVKKGEKKEGIREIVKEEGKEGRKERRAPFISSPVNPCVCNSYYPKVVRWAFGSYPLSVQEQKTTWAEVSKIYVCGVPHNSSLSFKCLLNFNTSTLAFGINYLIRFSLVRVCLC